MSSHGNTKWDCQVCRREPVAHASTVLCCTCIDDWQAYLKTHGLQSGTRKHFEGWGKDRKHKLNVEDYIAEATSQLSEEALAAMLVGLPNPWTVFDKE